MAAGDRKRSRTAGRRKGGGTPWALWLLLVVLAGYILYSHRTDVTTAYRHWRQGAAGAAVTTNPAPGASNAPAPAGTAATTTTAACGTGRLAVKDLYDPAAAAVMKTSAKTATIAELTQMPRPAGSDDAAAPRSEAEKAVYKVDASLVSYRMDEGQDIVLTLQDAHGNNLEAYLPAGQCTRNQDAADLFNELREDVSLRFGAPTATPTVLPKPIALEVKGVAFFGTPGKAGAVNGVALRPVLDFSVQ